MHEDSHPPVGGHLALEFTNTLSWDPSDPSAGEQLDSYWHLLDWSLRRGLISRRVHGVLVARAVRYPDDADRTHRQAIAVRAAMHDIFSRYAVGGNSPDSAPMAVLNGALATVPLKLRLAPEGADWDWSGPTEDLGAVMWPVIWSAASLLTSPDLSMVKQCAGDRCGWLFIDRSRRHNRKWCDMRDCGNRAKARRHYYRHRGSA